MLECDPIAGIGIDITKEQIMKTFKVENIYKLIDENTSDNVVIFRYGDRSVTGDDEDEFFCLVIYDLFINGIDGIQKTVNDFIQYLKTNNLPTDIRLISEILIW